jgi:predicted RNA-binding protein with PIN domain
MPYLIDGHNLIPKMGLRLDSMEDERELVTLLQEYCRLTRRTGLEVYFDGAPAGQAGTRRMSPVTAHFVPLGSSADEAIRKRLKALGKGAKNWTVVTSDRQVQTEARAARAEIISSETFAALLKEARASIPKPDKEQKLSQEEIEEWMRLFQKGKPREW